MVVATATPLLLRDRAGDYVRQLFAEASGFDGDPADLGSRPFSACSRDACVARHPQGRGGMAAARDALGDPIDWDDADRACASADIVVSDRRLPRGCTPRWLKLDCAALRRHRRARDLSRGHAAHRTVAERVGAHPWAQFAA